MSDELVTSGERDAVKQAVFPQHNPLLVVHAVTRKGKSSIFHAVNVMGAANELAGYGFHASGVGNPWL